MGGVWAISIKKKNEILTHKNEISIKTRKLDLTKISCYTVLSHMGGVPDINPKPFVIK